MLYAFPSFLVPQFNFFGLVSLPSWQVFYFLGIIASAIIVVIEAKRLDLPGRVFGAVFGLKLILAEGLGKILFWLSHQILHPDGSALTLQKWGGLGRVYFGDLLGTFLAIILGTMVFRRLREAAKYFDVFLLAHLGFIFFYRLGNLLNHAHIGKMTSVPWGFWYKGQIRHDPSFYELLSIAVLFILAWGSREKINKPGLLSLAILSWISLSRFITDFFRSDDLSTSNFHFSNGLTLNQIAYGILFVWCAGWIFYLMKKYGKGIFNIP